MVKEVKPPAYPPTPQEGREILEKYSRPVKHEVDGLKKGKKETFFVFKRVKMTTRDGRQIEKEVTVFAKDLKDAVEQVVVITQLAKTSLKSQTDILLGHGAILRMGRESGAFTLLALNRRTGQWFDIVCIDQFASGPTVKRIKHNNKKLGFNLNQAHKSHRRNNTFHRYGIAELLRSRRIRDSVKAAGRTFLQVIKKGLSGMTSKIPGGMGTAINQKLGIFTWNDQVDQIVHVSK